MSFVIGVAASLVAGLMLWLLTHPQHVRYALSSPRRTALRGHWHTYHLSRDAAAGSRPIWVHHEDHLTISKFGAVHGTSKGLHTKALTYHVSGAAREGILKITLTNRDAPEAVGTVIYPNLLGGRVLVGFLVGEDFDRRWYCSPVVMTRESLEEDVLNSHARAVSMYRPLSPRGKTSPIV